MLQQAYVEDPDYRALRIEFLNEVCHTHADHHYERDLSTLCHKLGVDLVEAKQNLYVRHGQRPTILLDVTEPRTRRAFSLAHELAHYLFRETDAAFHSVLEDHYPPERCPEPLRRAMEEALCNEAAALLLFPDRDVEEALRTHGVRPAAVLALTNHQGSIAAALIRVLASIHSELFGLILADSGKVEFDWATGKYRLGRHHQIEKHHPIQEAWHEPIECRAPLPFKGGGRHWKQEMAAASDGHRVIAIFGQQLPPPPDKLQDTLF